VEEAVRSGGEGEGSVERVMVLSVNRPKDAEVGLVRQYGRGPGVFGILRCT
jgi:hypothetical protein